MTEWTRIRHPQIDGEAVQPVDAVPFFPGFEAHGRVVEDPRELWEEIEAEREAAAELAAEQATRKAESAEPKPARKTTKQQPVAETGDLKDRE